MTAVMPALDDRRRSPDTPRPGPLGRLAGLAYRRRGSVLLAWAVALAIAAGLLAAFGGEFANGSSTPGSDSQRAQHLLGERRRSKIVQVAVGSATIPAGTSFTATTPNTKTWP